MKIYKKISTIFEKVGALPKDQQGYGYRYTDLATIMARVQPALAEVGLAVLQPLAIDTEGRNTLRTIIADTENGETIESVCVLPELTGGKMNAVQAFGASVTYMRRYSLCSLLGLVSDDDTDAQDVQAKFPTQKKLSARGVELARLVSKYEYQLGEAVKTCENALAKQDEKAIDDCISRCHKYLSAKGVQVE